MSYISTQSRGLDVLKQRSVIREKLDHKHSFYISSLPLKLESDMVSQPQGEISILVSNIGKVIGREKSWILFSSHIKDQWNLEYLSSVTHLHCKTRVSWFQLRFLKILRLEALGLGEIAPQSSICFVCVDYICPHFAASLIFYTCLVSASSLVLVMICLSIFILRFSLLPLYLAVP